MGQRFHSGVSYSSAPPSGLFRVQHQCLDLTLSMLAPDLGMAGAIEPGKVPAKKINRVSPETPHTPYAGRAMPDQIGTDPPGGSPRSGVPGSSGSSLILMALTGYARQHLGVLTYTWG
ncbi:MAG: hypothetical protein [Torentivirus crutis]|uniref:Uncharacterized protein n=1 Tax=Cressdnaviricota sp. TaxID=2748378 RepID=A0A3G2YU34_9VIRU|nr:MAG: hypothetical protein [Cressdnaviricota sp.]